MQTSYDICFLKEKLYTERVAGYKQNVVVSGENCKKLFLSSVF